MKRTFNMWGPKLPSDTNEGVNGITLSEDNKDSDKVSKLEHSERIGYTKKPRKEVALETKNVLPPTIKIRYGLFDVLNGFFLMLVLGFIVSIAFVAWEIKDVWQEAAANPDLITQALETTVTNPLLIATSAASMYIAWMLAVKGAARKAFGSIKRTFRVYVRPKDLILGLILAVTLRTVEMFAQMPFSSVFENEQGNAASAVSFDGIWYVINALIIASFLAPLFEEIFFRGLFLSAMLRKFTNWRKRNKGKVDWVYKSRYVVSVVITSTVFGLMHFPGGSTALNLITIIETGIIGAILAILTIKSKRLGPAITTHVFFNLSGVILATLAS